MTTAASATPVKPPFASLNKKERSAISKLVRDDFAEQKIDNATFEGFVKSIVPYLAKKKEIEELNGNELKVFNALNAAAADFIKNKTEQSESIQQFIAKKAERAEAVKAWKKELPLIQDLGPYLRLGGKVLLSGSCMAGGLGLFYLRSHKLIALACSCYALALLVFGSTSITLSSSSQQIGTVLTQLGTNNWNRFSPLIEQCYTEMKANLLMHIYLGMQEKKLSSQEHKGLQLVKEQLSAINHLKNIIQIIKNNILLHVFGGAGEEEKLVSEQIKPADLQLIQGFFEKFEGLCRSGITIGLGIGALAVAWTYYAYLQRSYLMVAAGVVHFIANFVITRELITLRTGSKKIKIGEQIESTFQHMASHSFLLSLMGLRQANMTQIRDMVVIPFNAIFKLIPSWETAS